VLRRLLAVGAALVLHGVSARGAGAASLAVSLAPPPSVLAARSGDDLAAAFAQEDLAESERLLRERIAAGDDPAAELGLAYVLACGGATKEALQQFERATQRLRRLPDSADTSVALAEALLAFGGLERDLGRAPEAERHLDEALRLREASRGADDAELVFYVADAAGAQFDLGRYEAARDGYARAVSLAERRFGPNGAPLAAAVRNLGVSYRENGQYVEAEASLRRALAIQTSASAPRLEIATTQSALAMALLGLDRTDEALAMTAQALAVREASLGPRDPATANSAHNLGIVRVERGDYRGAEATFRRALAIYEGSLRPDDPVVAETLQGVALALERQRRYGEARQALGRALAIQEKSLGRDHPATVKTRIALAERACADGSADGPALLRRLVSLRERTLGARHSLTGEALVELGKCLRKKDLAGASDALERGFSILGEAYGFADQRTLEALSMRAATAIDLGRLDEGQQFLDRGLAVAKGGTARRDTLVGEMFANAGTLQLERKDPERAAGYFEKALPYFERRLAHGDPDLAALFASLGMSYGYMNRWKPAVDALVRAVGIYDSGHSWPGDVREGAVLNMLGYAQAQLGDTAAAIRTFERLLPVGRRLYGDGHPAVQQTQAAIAGLREGKRLPP